jgi:hypothetical protein
MKIPDRPIIHFALQRPAAKYEEAFEVGELVAPPSRMAMSSEDWEYLAANRMATVLRLVRTVADAYKQPFDIAEVMDLLKQHLSTPMTLGLVDETEDCKITWAQS